MIVKADGVAINIDLIRHDPDEAGLMGGAPASGWMFCGHDAILAVDVGGTNIRAGVVELGQEKAKDRLEAEAVHSELWRHADEEAKRDDAVGRFGGMLGRLAKRAKKSGIVLAPVVGVGCPGMIASDGSIERGGQNLPGNWESTRFNLPRYIQEKLPSIGDHETVVVMHNDAVVQGLSQLPFMQAHEHWGVLTIGTGLGNARFTNRGKKPKD